MSLSPGNLDLLTVSVRTIRLRPDEPQLARHRRMVEEVA
jgi:hypothetical protein